MIQRQGQVVIQMLANVKQATIAPLIRAIIQPGTLVFTDQYKISARLVAWGYQHSLRMPCSRRVRPLWRIGTVSMNCMCIRWRVSGPCYAPGSDLIVAFPKKNYHFIWASLSSVHNARKRGKALLLALSEISILR